MEFEAYGHEHRKNLPTIEQTIFGQLETPRQTTSDNINDWSAKQCQPALDAQSNDVPDESPGANFALSHSLVSSGRFQSYS